MTAKIISREPPDMCSLGSRLSKKSPRIPLPKVRTATKLAIRMDVTCDSSSSLSDLAPGLRPR